MLPLHFFSEAPIFFLLHFVAPFLFGDTNPPPPSENHVSCEDKVLKKKIAFLLTLFLQYVPLKGVEKKNCLFAHPVFARSIIKKKIVSSSLAPFLGGIKKFRKKNNCSLAPFFSVENPSSIKLIWCGFILIPDITRTVFIEA